MYFGGQWPKPTLLKPQIGLMLQQEIAHKAMSLWNSLTANIPTFPWYTSDKPQKIEKAVTLGL